MIRFGWRNVRIWWFLTLNNFRCHCYSTFWWAVRRHSISQAVGFPLHLPQRNGHHKGKCDTEGCKGLAGVDWWTLATLPSATAETTQAIWHNILFRSGSWHGMSNGCRPWQSRAAIGRSGKAPCTEASLRGRFGIFDKHPVLGCLPLSMSPVNRDMRQRARYVHTKRDDNFQYDILGDCNEWY
jgi:hypothetical protein